MILAPFSLENKNILITGGATGLGLAMSESCIKAGAHIIMVNSRSSEEAQKDISHLDPSSYTYFQFDITKHEQIPILIAQIEEKTPIYGLVNNAGVHLKKPSIEVEIKEFQKVLDVHVLGSFAFSKAVLPYMIKRKEGNIIFIASMTSFIGMTNVIAYSAAKSAYLGMVRSLCSEYAEQGIRVNAIAPGWIDTPMFRKATDGDIERQQKILGRTPAKCYGKPEHIGWTSVFLLSEASQFINGTVIPVDGGAVIGF